MPRWPAMARASTDRRTTATDGEAVPVGRREARKAATRTALIAAARRLISEDGVAALRIGDVSEAAGVGFGTFYTYFESKEALIESVLADTLSAAAAGIAGDVLDEPDAAAAAAVAYRRFVRFASESPEMAGILVQTGDGEALFERAMLPHSRAVLERGIAAGRFAIDDVELALVSVSAAAHAAIRGVLTGRLDPGCEVAGAEMMLRGFGVGADDARSIARRPLADGGDEVA